MKRVLASIATTDGSLMTMPLPRTRTSVLAVPRSIPMSRENMPMTLLKGLPNAMTSKEAARGGGVTRRQPVRLQTIRVHSSRRIPGGESRQQDREVGARLLAQRRCDDVVECRGRRVGRAECAEHDRDGVVAILFEHL